MVYMCVSVFISGCSHVTASAEPQSIYIWVLSMDNAMCSHKPSIWGCMSSPHHMG